MKQKLLVILFSLLFCFVSAKESSSLNVLLVAAPFAGHANPLLALGEELVMRGHNVTFSSLDNWVNLRGVATERGISYLSAGEHGVTETEWRNIIFRRSSLKGFSSKNFTAIIEELMLLLNSKPMSGIDRISEYLFNIDLKQWDIIVTEHYLLQRVPCIAKSRNVPVVVTSMLYFSNQSPPWPFPKHLSAYSDNLCFKQRGINFLLHIFVSFFNIVMRYQAQHYVEPSLTSTLRKETFQYPVELGWEIPFIITTVLGLEYPRTISPLTTYVGPILSRKLINQSLPNDLFNWLLNKKNKSVIYISLGSQLFLSKEMVQEIINGINDTNYSVVWSMRNLNKSLHFNIDNGKYFISSWIPQATLLQHQSISMAIMHGGSNGIHESLYFGIPVIVIPFLGDQFDWAVRVSDAGVGVQLLLHQWTSSYLKQSVKMIENGGYRERAEKMSVLLRRAGGAQKAADLVELYATYGYDHLIPAPVKYKWSWIQYYNIDIYIVLLICLVALVMGFKMCWNCCKLAKKKVKQN